MPTSGKCPGKWELLILLALVFSSLSSFTLLPLNRVADKGVLLSHIPGIYDKSFVLSGEIPSSTEIVFSTNGELPSRSSSKWNKDLVIDKNTPLTIGLLTGSKLSDTFYCGTYLVGFHSTLPVSCLIIPPGDLFNEETGIYVGGLTPEGKTYGNCWKDIEKASFFEYYDSEQPVIAQGCGLKVFGGMTRQNKEKSLRIIAREKYGKGKFKYRFFSTKERDIFNSIVLRTSGNDYLGTRFLDMMISSIAKDIKVDYLAYQPSVLFVNGTYWGIHNLREKMNDDYLEENYGVSPDSTDLLLGNASAEVGSSKKYRELFHFLEKTPSEAPGFIDSLEERMDIQNYFNYLILEIHIINTDSRGNVRYWSSSSLDEKFRWVYYDGDLSFGNPRLNYLGKRLSDTQTDWYNPYWTTLLLRKLMQNQTLRNRFITQYCFLRSTMLSADTFESRINFFRNWLEPEIDRHLVRKDFKQTRSAWESRIKNLIRFARIRDTTSLRHLKENFSLGDTYTLSIDGNAPPNFYNIWINGNRLNSYPFTGQFFRKVNAEVAIKGIHPLYRFVAWSDGRTEKSRSIPSDSAAFVQLTAILKKVPFTSNKESIRLKALSTGRKDRLAYIYLTDSSRRHGPHKISISNLQGDMLIHATIEPNRHQLVVCNDIAKFRKIYPDYNGQIVHSNELLLSKDIQSLYVFAEDGFLLDSVNFRGIKGILNTQIPYYFRDSIYLTGSLERPLLTVLHFKDEQREFRESMYTFWAGLLMSLLLIFGLPFLIIQKRKKEGALLLLFLQASWPAISQEHFNESKRLLNQHLLLKKGKIHEKLPVSTSCYRFFCRYAPVNAKLIWVAPFKQKDIVADPSIQRYKKQFYKEWKSAEMMHVRMQYKGDTIRNFIAGTSMISFPLDSTGKWKLVKVVHPNGMESWYYPVRKENAAFDPKVKGSAIGTGNGTYFWQIRYRERTFALSGLLQSDHQPDPKGYFLESGYENNGGLIERYQAFVYSLRSYFQEKGLRAKTIHK